MLLSIINFGQYTELFDIYYKNVQMYVYNYYKMEWILFYEKRKMIIAIYNLQHTVSYCIKTEL